MFHSNYDDHAQEMGDRNRRTRQAGQDIGDIPPVANQVRRDSCERDLWLFGHTYFAAVLTLLGSDDHRRIVMELEQKILNGGMKAFSMPRGSGKTAWVIIAACWALLYGHCKFVVILGPDAGHAEGCLSTIDDELNDNELFGEDFPEVAWPLAKLDRQHQRRIRYKGERVNITLTKDALMLPDITGSKSCGARVQCKGLQGSVRGLFYRSPSGERVRPDLVLIDDPQTDETAKSPTMTKARVKKIRKAVKGLGGPGKKLTIFATVTVIEKHDLADQLLNPKLMHGWNGERVPFFHSEPTDKDAWDKYKTLRLAAMRGSQPPTEANEFYAANQAAMDDGARPYWPARFDPQNGEISAIQHGMNVKIDDPEFYASEYQGEPLEEVTSDVEMSPDEIVKRLSHVPRGYVPLEATHLTAFVDVQNRVLYWIVIAWAPGFRGWVIDYGTFPQQRRDWFTAADVTETLEGLFPGQSQAEQWYSGLKEIVGQLMNREWPRFALPGQDASGAAPLRVGLLGIDAQAGQANPIVYRFARQSSFGAHVLPCHGFGMKATEKNYAQRAIKPNVPCGDEWETPQDGRHKQKHLNYNTNHHKTKAAHLLTAPAGATGGIYLFGDVEHVHGMYADHASSEYCSKVIGPYGPRDIWQIRPQRSENHWWDGTVACSVLASILGITHLSIPMPAKRVRRSLSDMRSSALAR